MRKLNTINPKRGMELLIEPLDDLETVKWKTEDTRYISGAFPFIHEHFFEESLKILWD